MKSNTRIKLDDAIKNAEKYVEEMKKMDDKKLSKHLELFRIQMQKAYETNNHEAFSLLYEYEKQVIIARANKKD